MKEDGRFKQIDEKILGENTENLIQAFIWSHLKLQPEEKDIVLRQALLLSEVKGRVTLKYIGFWFQNRKERSGVWIRIQTH